MISPIFDVLDALILAGDNDIAKTEAILDDIQTFYFAFMVHLMKLVMGITYPLSLSLQRRDQDIANVIRLLHTAKRQFQMTRN